MATVDESPGRYSNAQSVIQWPNNLPDCAMFVSTERHRRSVCQIIFQMDGSNVPKHLLEGSHHRRSLHLFDPEHQAQFSDNHHSNPNQSPQVSCLTAMQVLEVVISMRQNNIHITPIVVLGGSSIGQPSDVILSVWPD